MKGNEVLYQVQELKNLGRGRSAIIGRKNRENSVSWPMLPNQEKVYNTIMAIIKIDSSHQELKIT
jgi:hypothetical protein